MHFVEFPFRHGWCERSRYISRVEWVEDWCSKCWVAWERCCHQGRDRRYVRHGCRDSCADVWHKTRYVHAWAWVRWTANDGPDSWDSRDVFRRQSMRPNGVRQPMAYFRYP